MNSFHFRLQSILPLTGLVFVANLASAIDRVVPGDHATVLDALTAAGDGDAIRITNSSIYTGDLFIDKRITVDGEDHHFGEGFIVGLVEVVKRLRWRELGQHGGDEGDRSSVDAVQAGCECGWRSRRFLTRYRRDVSYMPYCVFVPEVLEEQLAKLWQSHDCGGMP